MARLPGEEKIQRLLSAYRDGELDVAERLARGMTRKWPEYDLGWNILSASLHAVGKLEKAAAAYRKAIALNPRHAELRDNYGALLIQQGKAAEAEKQFREGLALDGGSWRGHSNLGLALTMMGDYDAAVEHCSKAVKLDPDNPSSYNTLGNALRADRREEEAIDAYSRAVQLNPYYAKAHFNLAAAYQGIRRVEEAEKHYRLAIHGNPDYTKARNALGNLLAMTGRLDEAQAAYRAVLERQPGCVEAYRYLAWLKRFSAGDPDLANIEKLLDSDALGPAERAQLHYAAGKAYEDTGIDDETAFTHFVKGAALKRAEHDYDVQDDEQLFRAIADACRADIAPPEPPAQGTPIPVFIVGMPRSGTTLVEQIIASHSDVQSLGEADYLPRVIEELDAGFGCPYPEWSGKTGGDMPLDPASTYLRHATRLYPGSRAYTDKTPDNFRYLGLVAALFPGARIIHVVRSPLDTCVSCFTQYFSSPIPYSYDLGELARYYRAYRDLMTHWRRVLPGGLLLEVEYEALTSAPAEQARRMIAHCGLEWQDRCLDFQRNDGMIETASVAQARRPVNRDSVGRWKRYEKWLAPLIRELGNAGR